MDMFAHDDEVWRLQELMSSEQALTLLDLQIDLAWHLRQRDSARALDLVAGLRQSLAGQALPVRRQHQYSGRLALICGEIHWLFSELPAAEAMALQAMHDFAAIDDGAGLADTHWLQSWIANSRGNSASQQAGLEAAAAAAFRAGDVLRANIAEAELARWVARSDAPGARLRWGPRFDPALPRPVALDACVHDWWGGMATLASDYGGAVSHYLRAFACARQTGQLRRAIVTAVNIGNALNALNDNQAAIEWTRRALDLARPTGVAQHISLCLSRLAEALRRVGQLQTAQELVDEAHGMLQAMNDSRNFCILLITSFDIALDRGDGAQALQLLQQLQEIGTQLQHDDLRFPVCRGRAQAYTLLGQPQEALLHARRAEQIALKNGSTTHQISVLRILARLYSRFDLEPPEADSGMAVGTGFENGEESGSAVSMQTGAIAASRCPAPSLALSYLQQALQLAGSVNGYTVCDELYHELAHEYARLGQHQVAYEHVLRAIDARNKLHDQQVLQRANALQVQFQTECARAEARHQRMLAEAEAQRVQLLEQASLDLARLNAQKMAAEQEARCQAEQITLLKSQFLAAMSHEIRTPMNAILGMAYLARATPLLPKQQDYLDKIHRASVSLLGIINDVLDIAKIESGQLELDLQPFLLDELFAQLASLTSHKAAEKQQLHGLDYRLDIDPFVPIQLCGDGLRLGQVLLNLLNNALKFTSRGQVRLSCTLRKQMAGHVRLRFAVQDSGIGMSQAQVARLFQPFEQAESSTSRHYGGTGLGLSIARKLVHLMGGSIALETSPGRGACFSFELDFALAFRELCATCRKAAPREMQQFPGMRVLLVEDDALNRQIEQELLLQLGMAVDLACHGQQALDMLFGAPPHTWQLVLMDLDMPVLDGHAATRALRLDARYAALPVVAVTAHALLETRERCLRGGMQDYLSKPLDPLLLNRVLARWLLPGRPPAPDG